MEQVSSFALYYQRSLRRCLQRRSTKSVAPSHQEISAFVDDDRKDNIPSAPTGTKSFMFDSEVLHGKNKIHFRSLGIHNIPAKSLLCFNLSVRSLCSAHKHEPHTTRFIIHIALQAAPETGSTPNQCWGLPFAPATNPRRTRTRRTTSSSIPAAS